ncbi:tetratricopeptide repeat protein [Streptomyces sp. NBC_00455]|uniref:tetratricopeptide repeat protein n=1 Tax=Streptomyces sp. NBC_00455 TaxID=2903654 RepID=UPI002E22C46E
MPIPESGRAAALLSAMVVCGSERTSPAWRELAEVARTASGQDPSVARLRFPVDAPENATAADTLQDMARLATALAASARADAHTASRVDDWLRRHAPGPARPEHTNTVGGTAVLHGPSVQARDIRGGVHFHQQAGPESPRPPVPRQLPPIRRPLVARDGDARALDRLRAGYPAQSPQLLVVSGFAGVGKTTLVSHWMHGLADSFPDGQLYADLGGRASATEDGGGPIRTSAVLEGFLYALGASSVPVDTAQRMALWRSLTSELRLAVLLDDAYTSAQVRPLLLGSPTGLTVVTSRNHLTGLLVDGAATHRLGALAPESAVELLAAGGGGQRVTQDPETAREVVTLCGCLPLAVCLASAQLAARPHHTLSALARSLSRGQGPLDTLRVDGEAVVRTALDLSYRLLPAVSAALYRRMGLLPADRFDLSLLTAISGDAAHGRYGQSDEGAGREAGEADVLEEAGWSAAPDGSAEADLAVGALLEANLLEETGPGTYRFHDLVRPHARRLGETRESTAERERTLRRFVDWCLASATAAESILTPGHRTAGRGSTVPGTVPAALETPAEALAWLDTHRNSLLGAVRHSARAGWHTACWQLTDAAWPLFVRLRPREMWIEMHRTGLAAARSGGSREGEGRMLTSGAIGLRDAGRYPEAADWYAQALEHATADGDVRQQAQAINGLGHISLLACRYDEARAHFERALRLRESVGYARGAALSRRRLGETALAAGDHRTAARYLAGSFTELESQGEGYEAARALALLGRALARDGDHEGGTRRLREALGTFRSSDVRSGHWEGYSLEWLGEAAAQQGDTAESVRCYEAARDLFLRLSPADAQRLDERLRHL